jgi:hypothetical protein
MFKLSQFHNFKIPFGIRVTVCLVFISSFIDLIINVPCFFKNRTSHEGGNGFGAPDIYVTEGEQDEDTDKLFLDSDGDYGEDSCGPRSWGLRWEHR